MQKTTIQALEARRRLGELLELAYYKGKTFRIARKDKPMAWIVGEQFMQDVDRILDYIIEHEPALADTLAVMVDDEIREAILKSRQEYEQGKIIPIEEALQ